MIVAVVEVGVGVERVFLGLEHHHQQQQRVRKEGKLGVETLMAMTQMEKRKGKGRMTMPRMMWLYNRCSE
jgi:lysozyme family protein